MLNNLVNILSDLGEAIPELPPAELSLIRQRWQSLLQEMDHQDSKTFLEDISNLVEQIPSLVENGFPVVLRGSVLRLNHANTADTQLTSMKELPAITKEVTHIGLIIEQLTAATKGSG